MMCTDESSVYETHFIGGPKDGTVEVLHVCGTHRAGGHDHFGSRGHMYVFADETLNQRGFWDIRYADYLLTCEAVDNFVTLTYDGMVSYEHGHRHRQPCHCYERSLE